MADLDAFSHLHARVLLLPMSAATILDEAQRLQRLSDRLDSLAEQHPKASDALLKIAIGIRDTAVLLEVLVATRISLPSRLQ
jgi:nitrogen-specific signal transduction histidine kinase